MANEQNLKPFTGADDPRRVNGAPKGSIHLSTRIQNMLNDDDFTVEEVVDGKKIQFKGNPAQAIINTAILKAKNGDKQWADWLAQHGYGSKQILEIYDSRKPLLKQYMGGEEYVGEAEEATSGSPTDSA